MSRDVYLGSRKRRLPPWLLPLLLILLFSFLLFYFLPSVIHRWQARQDDLAEKAHSMRFAEDLRRVTAATLPIFAEPNEHLVWKSSLLFNEIVQTLGPVDAKGFQKIRSQDGCEGYVRAAYLSQDMRSLDPELATKKVLVIGAYKYLMSDAIRGEVMLEIPMGSIFYADYAGHDVYRLELEKDQVGWVGQSAVLAMDPNEKISEKQHPTAQLFVSAAMSFYNSLYRPGGLDHNGIDMAGVVFIAARIYGLDLPRTLPAQAEFNSGQSIQLPVGGNPEDRLRPLLHGDVLYMTAEKGDKTISEAAIVIEKGQVLMHRLNDSTITVRQLRPEDIDRIVSVRRFFPQAAYHVGD